LNGVLSKRELLGIGLNWDIEGRWMAGLREPGARADSADVDQRLFLVADRVKGCDEGLIIL
jgi:hypothetical protein